MYLFTATGFEGEITECNEGDLEWVLKSKVCELPIWEGDKLFFKKLEETDRFFTMKLRYEGERLAEYDCHVY